MSCSRILRSWKNDGSRGWRICTENSLVRYILQKIVLSLEICSQYRNCYQSQLKRQIQTVVSKSREIMREPEQESEELPAVSRLTPDLEVDGRAGKTKIEAPESTRNLLELSESWRQTRGEGVDGPACTLIDTMLRRFKELYSARAETFSLILGIIT